MNKITAILLAGGQGSRFDPSQLKTLHRINGVTLTEAVIRNIKKCGLFDEIILVYNKKFESEFSEISDKLEIASIGNGKTRFMSAKNGIEISSNEKNIFIDVAAPFYEVEMLERMILSLSEFDGVMTTVFDSRADHVLVINKKVERVFKRGEILRVKSYQGINKSPWLNSIANESNMELDKYTEMLNILIKNNYKIGNVTAKNNPRKITTKDDLRFFHDEKW